ncbi:MAG: hypothetical protein QXE01_07110 [Sulfolobales archaeon]
MSRCPCVARTGIKIENKNKYVRKFIRISCGNTIFATDKNEVNEYKRIVIDDEFLRDCQVYDDSCVDCIAYCDDTLLVIEVTNEEGLNKHVEISSGRCKIRKRVCLNDIIKTIDVLVLYGISYPRGIYDTLNCSNIRHEYVKDLRELCNTLCSKYQNIDNDALIVVYFSST